ncbi:interferon regulatory factor 4-like [Pelodytes ibericus]
MSNIESQQLRLKEWLILQIDSGKYPGLRWENSEKTLFRIPWKHASKQDYKAQQDAALFKAWAIYKGKLREGLGKDDPSVWKTRLRCALNKSPDFQEVQENSQMELAEPYKQYRIVSGIPERNEKGTTDTCKSPTNEDVQIIPKLPHPPDQPAVPKSENSIETHDTPKIHENKSQQIAGYSTTLPFHWLTHTNDHKAVDISDQDFAVPSSSSDFWLHVRLYYQGKLVMEVTTQTAEGCRIVPWSLTPRDFSVCPAVLLEEILLPSPSQLSGIISPDVGQVVQKLFVHLDHGVLLWVAPEGVFVKRQCQVRVYWIGPLAPHTDQPNKLERERTCKVFDTEHFMHDLHMYMTHRGPEPQYQIQLCFGEEYPDVNKQNSKKLVTAHVEPVFARERLLNAKKKMKKKAEDP